MTFETFGTPPAFRPLRSTRASFWKRDPRQYARLLNFALFSRLGCLLVEVIHFRLISRKNFIIRHMAEEITSLVEEGSSNDEMPQDATPDPMETVIKELADLRRVNQKLNERLDSMLHPKAKKRLFNKRKRSSVDPSCSVSIIFNDLIAL